MVPTYFYTKQQKKTLQTAVASKPVSKLVIKIQTRAH